MKILRPLAGGFFFDQLPGWLALGGLTNALLYGSAGYVIFEYGSLHPFQAGTIELT